MKRGGWGGVQILLCLFFPSSLVTPLPKVDLGLPALTPACPLCSTILQFSQMKQQFLDTHLSLKRKTEKNQSFGLSGLSWSSASDSQSPAVLKTSRAAFLKVDRVNSSLGAIMVSWLAWPTVWVRVLQTGKPQGFPVLPSQGPMFLSEVVTQRPSWWGYLPGVTPALREHCQSRCLRRCGAGCRIKPCLFFHDSYHGLWSKVAWFYTPTLLFLNCMILEESLNLCEPQFSHM